MHEDHKRHRRESADQGTEHVGLRVTLIALDPKKFFCALAECELSGPFDELVDSTERHRHAYADKLQEVLPLNAPLAEQQLTRDQRRHRAQQKVTEASVRVAAEL